MAQQADPREINRQAISALQAGNASAARESFQRLLALTPSDTNALLGLAFACAQLRDDAATLDAVNRLLALEPRNLRGLLFKADHFDQTGRQRPALRFYQAALQVASREPQISPDIAKGLQRARKMVEEAARQDDATLMQALRNKGYDPLLSSPRFNQSLDISLGRKQVFLQSPTVYYFPALPQIQFYEREQFDWIPAMEAQTSAIRAELRALLQRQDNFSPYLSSDPEAPELNDRSQLDNPDWSACFLWKDGERQAIADHCPATMRALESAPVPMIPGRSPNVLFSKLNPHTRIPPHNGLLNTRLIGHLPLIVPQNCGALRVGNESRAWEAGKMLIFDDSVEHEAWNDSNEERVVLLFEFWRPELSAEERTLVSTLLETTREFSAATE